jgi:hypothetical protein
MKMKLATSDQKKADKTKRGSAGVVRSMMLLNSFEEMHAPYTQVYLYKICHYFGTENCQHPNYIFKSSRGRERGALGWGVHPMIYINV